jgi:S1-C subfamily serine protease
MKGSQLMKTSLMLPLVMATQLLPAGALAQGSGRNVTIFKMGGPQLGVRLEEVDQAAVARLKLKEEKGALVTEVMEKSAAEKAGIRKDDVIVAYQGESVLTAAQLRRLVLDTPAGRKVAVDLVRAGAPVKVNAILERTEFSEGDLIPPVDAEDLSERLGRLGELHFKSGEGHSLPRSFSFKMDENGPGGMTFPRAGRGRLGIMYTEIEGQLAGYFKAPGKKAVLVNSVVEGSAAEKAGLKAGDLLIKLAGVSVEDGSDLQEAVRDIEAGKAMPLTVWRDGKSVELSVTLADETSSKASSPRRRPSVS